MTLDRIEEMGSEFIDLKVDKFKMRMLLWDNPVEFVNNMYCCHPGRGEELVDYFEEVFGE